MVKDIEKEWDSLLSELSDWVDEKEELDAETAARAEEIGEYFKELLVAYDADENNIMGILADDDYLLEELSDKLALVNIIEMSEEEMSPEQKELPYLSLMDTCFETAKVINPLAGFGKDRLEAGLGTLRSFEKKYWPLVSRVTKNNAAAFRNFIPSEHYDDIVEGRKKALGAVRHKGSAMFVAGVVVFSINPIPRASGNNIKLEWIYVADAYKKTGVGNMLMAELAGYAIQAEGSIITLDMNVPDISEDAERERFAVLENFLDSWKFVFGLRAGNNFCLQVSDIKDVEYMAGSTDGVKSLEELGIGGEMMLKRFFKTLNHSYDAKLLASTYSFFDPKVSCVITENMTIKAALLFHRQEKGYYRYETVRSLPDHDPAAIIKLIRFACRAAIKRDGEKSILYGKFESDEGFATMKKLFPETRSIMQYHGELSAPLSKDIISSEQWAVLRKEAGLSDEKIPAGELKEEDFSQERMDKLAEFLRM
ncbi:MAG: hypothetical protein K6A72_08765 [Lachnospiraceae bacterium]|nr:hypothetical protein [Lachnospiraceae bacterium]